MKLQEIIKELKEICKKEDLDISADCLFENSVKLKISENIDKSHKEMYQNKEKVNTKPFVSENKAFEQATEKQRNFLMKIGKYKEGMSKQDAFNVIQSLSSKKKVEY